MVARSPRRDDMERSGRRCADRSSPEGMANTEQGFPQRRIRAGGKHREIDQEPDKKPGKAAKGKRKTNQADTADKK
jgi:hypothetical protein